MCLGFVCHRISIHCMDFSLSSLVGRLGCIQFSSLQTILQLLAYPRPFEHSGLVTEVYLPVREINLGERGGLFRSPSHPHWLPAPRHLGQLLGQAGSATAVRGGAQGQTPGPRTRSLPRSCIRRPARRASVLAVGWFPLLDGPFIPFSFFKFL